LTVSLDVHQNVGLRCPIKYGHIYIATSKIPDESAGLIACVEIVCDV